MGPVPPADFPPTTDGSPGGPSAAHAAERAEHRLVARGAVAARPPPWIVVFVVPANGLRFSCGPKPAATRMNLFLWYPARQLQAPG
jgi:hypothetical protein